MTRINKLNEKTALKSSDKLAIYDASLSSAKRGSIALLADKMREMLGIDDLEPPEVVPTAALIYNGSGEIYFDTQDVLSATNVAMTFNGGTEQYFQPGFNNSFKFDNSNTNYIDIQIDLATNQGGIVTANELTLRRVGADVITLHPFTSAYLKTRTFSTGLIAVEAFERFEILVNTGTNTDRVRIYAADDTGSSWSKIKIDSYQQEFVNV